MQAVSLKPILKRLYSISQTEEEVVCDFFFEDTPAKSAAQAAAGSQIAARFPPRPDR
jgi:hypothetical protein